MATSSVSKTGGVYSSNDFAISPIIYSLVLPFPVLALGCIERTSSRRIKVSFYFVVISAFSCRPNASGSGLRGRDFIYSTYSSFSPTGITL